VQLCNTKIAPSVIKKKKKRKMHLLVEEEVIYLEGTKMEKKNSEWEVFSVVVLFVFRIDAEELL